jgi:hypothetical protein
VRGKQNIVIKSNEIVVCRTKEKHFFFFSFPRVSRIKKKEEDEHMISI